MSSSNLYGLLIGLVSFLLIFLIVSQLSSIGTAIGALIAAVVAFVAFMACTGHIKLNWTAIAAITAVLSTMWAVWFQEVRHYFSTPRLEVSLFESNHPWAVKQTGSDFDKGGPQSYRGLFVTMKVINTGKRTAARTRVLLTKVGSLDKNGQWTIEEKWIGTPLQWVLPLPSTDIERQLARDLVPNLPLHFRICSFSLLETRKGNVLLTYIMSYSEQREMLAHGEHCLEIRFFNDSGDLFPPKYIRVKFEDFSKAASLEEIAPFIKEIEVLDQSPWKE